MSSISTGKRNFFGRKKKEKIDLRETQEEKRRRKMTTKGSDPTKAMLEEEPFAAAQATQASISQLRHKDVYGNEIVDPDRSNPTRHRLERPLDTIRSFERAIYNDDREHHKRSSRFEPTPQGQGDAIYRGGQYDGPSSQRANGVRQYQQEAYGSDGNQYRDNYAQNSRNSYISRGRASAELYNVEPIQNSPSAPGTADTASASYGSRGGTASTADPYSTNPSSESSSYRGREVGDQFGPPVPKKTPSPLSRSQMAYNEQQQQNYVQNGVSPISPVQPQQYEWPQQQQQQLNGYNQQHQQSGNGVRPQYNGYNQENSQPQQNYGNPSSSYPQQYYNSHPSQQTQSHSQQNYSDASQYQNQPAYQQSTQNFQQRPNVLSKVNSGSSPKSPGTEKRKSWFRRTLSTKDKR